LKKLTTLLIKTYLGPFLATFFIAMFFLVMQFLWRYVDDLMGKGLDFSVIAEFMFYASLSLVPMALPLAILLSSIMTFGALGESNELTAMKSAGLSLFKIMRPITSFIIVVSFGAFLFGNYTWPWANLKWKTLYWEILESKPGIQITEKLFYNEIPNFTIRVNNKSTDGKTLEDIIIYDYRNPYEYRKRDVRAKEGKILKSNNPSYMLFQMDKGVIYSEELDGNKTRGAKFPFSTTTFESANLKFDISGFKLSRGDEDLFKDSYEMLNIFQINTVTDSLQKTLKIREADYLANVKNRHLFFRPRITVANKHSKEQDSLNEATALAYQKLNAIVRKEPVPANMNTLENKNPAVVNSKLQPAIETCANSIMTIENSINETTMRKDSLMKYAIEWHRKFTLPFACLVIFFIGAPLGAIVRKGGLGTPMVISVLLFLLYHILTITGEKMAKSGTVEPFTGMWFSAFILTPIGLLLTWLAAKESNLMQVKTYFGYFGRIFKMKKK
jgi:lipopolysaccharide export system permease protein